MPTRKIKEKQEKRCNHPEHDVPTMQVFEPGLYEHSCPKCGASFSFRVEECTLQ